MARDRPPLALLLGTLVLFLVATIVFALGVGAAEIAPMQVVRALLKLDGDTGESRIILNLRLPRVLAAAATGGLLATSGVLLQASLRNRLAEPFTVGSSAGALLGASLGLALAPGAARVGAPPSNTDLILRLGLACLFAWLATLLALHVARRSGGYAAGPLLLSGLASNALVGAFAGLVLFLGSQGAQTAATLITTWTHGGLLAEATPRAYLLPLAVLAGVVLFVIPLARSLDALLLGEHEAVTAGVDVRHAVTRSLAATIIATATAVTIAGVIAFVGLLAPRLVDPWSGPHLKRRLPAALLAGATLLVAADALGRTLARPGELPAGILTAALGAPLLLLWVAKDLGGHDA